MVAVQNKPKTRGGFQPGKSGNPGGRPKKTVEELDLIQACREKTKDAMATICSLMESADKDSVRLGAATYIIDRGWGKAVQIVENKDENSLTQAATVLLLAMRDKLVQHVADKKPTLINGH